MYSTASKNTLMDMEAELAQAIVRLSPLRRVGLRVTTDVYRIQIHCVTVAEHGDEANFDEVFLRHPDITVRAPTTRQTCV